MDKKDVVRCELNGKKLSRAIMACSPDLKLALVLEAEELGLTLSELLEKISYQHVVRQGLPRKRDKHLVELEVEQLYYETVAIFHDGVMDSTERQRFTKIASRVLNRVWNQAHEEAA